MKKRIYTAALFAAIGIAAQAQTGQNPAHDQVKPASERSKVQSAPAPARVDQADKPVPVKRQTRPARVLDKHAPEPVQSESRETLPQPETNPAPVRKRMAVNEKGVPASKPAKPASDNSNRVPADNAKGQPVTPDKH